MLIFMICLMLHVTKHLQTLKKLKSIEEEVTIDDSEQSLLTISPIFSLEGTNASTKGPTHV
jgi:hypothetical protein